MNIHYTQTCRAQGQTQSSPLTVSLEAAMVLQSGSSQTRRWPKNREGAFPEQFSLTASPVRRLPLCWLPLSRIPQVPGADGSSPASQQGEKYLSHNPAAAESRSQRVSSSQTLYSPPLSRCSQEKVESYHSI
ncbi:unnamed protein product [Pleuronectes platessa]|uniref:Uncharacterized protein n=1 Tax=Pleuronectes platessa TaxID=8262 RepID=A0A9N7V5B5_PLEPL|nr:unnamed protein product [Pleuronectes platessa]